ncbi:hypothetical protein AV530_001159 [Patagioenas fasciata monilis]|uniref:Uncharacterized protein n=1 Tax=Patagioenas fasciata monilis TaxID=372326 RepID=A0A1V4KTP9_PATFA|nr:hypothetical protein AV530_001159 [Patagioenas fasciata monilis]
MLLTLEASPEVHGEFHVFNPPVKTRPKENILQKKNDISSKHWSSRAEHNLDVAMSSKKVNDSDTRKWSSR